MIALFTIWFAIVSFFLQQIAAFRASLEDDGLSCTFVVNQLEFDLCPLVKTHSTPFEIVTMEETPPTRTKEIYTVSLGGQLKRDGTLPEELQCPEGTQICLTVVNTRPNHPSEPSRILQVVPVAGGTLNPRATLAKKSNEGDHHAPLQITLHGGSYMHQPQKATFIFHCNHDAEEPSMPSFLWKFNGTHAFSWITRHACHKPLATPQLPPEPDPDPPQEPPKDPDLDSGEELQRPAPRPTFKLYISLCFIFLALATYFLLHRRKNLVYRRLSSPFVARVTRIQPKPPLRTRFLPRPSTKGYRSITNIPKGIILYNHPGSDSDDEGEEVPLTPSPSGTFGRGSRHTEYYGSF